MAKPPSPLDFHTEIKFHDKVPLAKRKEIIERLAGALSECILTSTVEEQSLDDMIESASVYCHSTSQEITIPLE